jgi:exosortase/archaeosortase
MNPKQALDMVLRYFILAIIALSNLSVIYALFTPLTVYPVFYIMKLMYGSAMLSVNEIAVNGDIINLIPACIAGSAYFLLLILNLSAPMKPKTRACSLAFLLSSFLVLNIIRIVMFSVLAVSGFSYFDISHELAWFFGSTLIVAMLWFINIYLFKIREIPLYTDVKEMLKDIRWP